MGDRAREQHRPSSSSGGDTEPAARPSAAQQEAGRRAGMAAVARITADEGRPVGDAELERVGQESVVNASASVTDVAGEEIYRDGHTVITIRPGTRLSASLDPGGFALSADPGFQVKNIGPTTIVTTARYDFHTAKFELYGSARFDLFGLWAHVVRGKVEKALETRFKPLLPTKMQQPGYLPANDHDLQSTVQGITHLFNVDGRGATAAQAAAELAGAEGRKGQYFDPSGWARLQAPEALHVPLGTDALELFLGKGTVIDIRADASGSLAKPHLELLTVRSSSPGISVRSTGKGLLDNFKGLTMKEVAITPGGHFKFDYDLDVEQMADGLTALVALFGIAAGQAPPDRLPDAKFQSVRKELDARLQSEVPPRFKEFLVQFDRALPGFSLRDIFGTR